MNTWKIKLAGALLCSVAIGLIFSTPVHAAGTQGGLDSDSDTLPISVNGQPAFTLTASDPGAPVPSVAGVAVLMPITIGGTTVAEDGTMTIGSNLATPPTYALNVSGSILAAGVTTTGAGGVATTTGGDITAYGNITATNGYVQPAGYADSAQPSCGPPNQGALIYSTSQNATLFCNGSTRRWEAVPGTVPSGSMCGFYASPNGGVGTGMPCKGYPLGSCPVGYSYVTVDMGRYINFFGGTNTVEFSTCMAN